MTGSLRNVLLIVFVLVTVGVALTQITYVPKSSAEEFGVGTVECAAAIGPTSADGKILESNGWKKLDSANGADRYERSDLNVRLIVKAGTSGCLMQGFAEGEDQFPAIVDAVKNALKSKYSGQFSELNSGSRGEKNYQTGNLLHVLSAKEVSDGYQIRVTSIWNQSR